jgi:hypothetical protein
MWLCYLTVLRIASVELRFSAAAFSGRRLFLDDGLLGLALSRGCISINVPHSML